MLKKTVGKFAFVQYWRGGFFIFLGIILLHLVVELMSIFIFSRNSNVYLDVQLLAKIFSIKMIPHFIIYAFFLMLGMYFINKTRIMQMRIDDSEMKGVRSDAIMETSQAITAMVIEHISDYNREIVSWIENKKAKGETPPKKIIESSKNIGTALNALSEVSYLLPYTNTENWEVTDYEAYLNMIMNGDYPGVSADKLN